MWCVYAECLYGKHAELRAAALANQVVQLAEWR